MKKKFFLSHIYFYMILAIFVGYFVGRDIENDFLNLYSGKFVLLPFRYIMLTLIIFISNSVFNLYSKSEIIIRNKNYFMIFMNILKKEITFFILLFIFFNIPIFFMNINPFINNLRSILIIMLNFLIISMIISCIIKTIDLNFKNRFFSSCLFLVCFSLVDIIVEYLNFNFVINEVDLSHIFIIPMLINNYLMIMFISVLFIIINTFLIIFFSYRKDYFLRNEKF